MATAHQHGTGISPLRPLHFGSDGRGVVPSHVVPHADEQPAKNVHVRGSRLGHRISQRVNLERRQHKDRRERRRQGEEQPKRSSRDDLHAHDIEDRANDHHAQRDRHATMILLEPGKHACEVGDKQGGINRHIENGRYQRKPRFLKSPEISHGASHPGVVAAFKGQGARKLADHERGRQAPEKRGQQQYENRFAIARAVHDVLGAISSSRDHKEGRGDQGPKREANRVFLRLVVLGSDVRSDARNKARLRKVRACGSCCQFLWLPPPGDSLSPPRLP